MGLYASKLICSWVYLRNENNNSSGGGVVHEYNWYNNGKSNYFKSDISQKINSVFV